jgi:delta8-fatty-acid desaturase
MHTQATLQTMERYRIGKVLKQWENMKPPVQGGVYHMLGEEEADALPDNASIVTGHDEQVSDMVCGAASDSSSIDSLVKQSANRGPMRGEDHVLGHVDNTLNFVNKISDVNGVQTPAKYVANAVQEEINFDTARYPSLDPDMQRNIAIKFQALHQRVKDEGFYQCRFIEYGKEMVRYTALFTLFVFTLNNGWYMVSACFLGLFWHQIMFTAHDAGHRGITRNITADTLIGIFIADFCCGLSIGWWKSSHNVHHLVTNAPVRTPCYVFASTFHSPLTLTA